MRFRLRWEWVGVILFVGLFLCVLLLRYYGVIH